MTIKMFCNRHGITATAEWADSNPNMSDMPAGSSHWRVTLRRRNPRRSLTVPFSMGPAHSHEPTAPEVLDCLVSDASSFDSASSFEDWCSDFGYDTDSRKAEQTFKAVERSAARLRRFLGGDYDQAISAERL